MNKNLSAMIIGREYVGSHTALKVMEEFLPPKIDVFDIDEDKINRWNKRWNKNMPSNIELDIKNSNLIIVASNLQEFNELLKNYNKTAIDLKTFIKGNGMMALHFIGGRK